ncbi:MAG: TldD/PmbA family protein [Actinomycetota bacterium]
MSISEVVRRVVESAVVGEALEAFAVDSVETSARVHDGEVEALTSAATRGLGVRVIRNARLGYAFTADLSDAGLVQAVEAARANAALSMPDEANVLPGPAVCEPLEGIAFPDVDEMAPEAKVAMALELESIARAADPRVRAVEAAQYADGRTRVALASTAGVFGTYERTDAAGVVAVMAGEGAETQTGFGFSMGRRPSEVDVTAAGREAAERATRLLGARKPPSARVPIVFDPMVTASLLGVVARALSAEAVRKGRSLFAGKLGEQVAAAGIDLVDDARLLAGPAASPFDDEGVPSRRNVLLRGGVLEALLHNTFSAAKDGVAPTGNGYRGSFKATPGISPTNLFLVAKTASVAEILSAAEGGFYVQDVAGLHSGTNPVSGDFSVGASGLWIRSGALGEPAREVTVAGNLSQILHDLAMVGSDLRFFPLEGGMGGATVLITEMTVAGA